MPSKFEGIKKHALQKWGCVLIFPLFLHTFVNHTFVNHTLVNHTFVNHTFVNHTFVNSRASRGRFTLSAPFGQNS